MAKKKIQISVDEDLLDKLDKKAGLIPRSAYINELIRKDLME
jgi:metal-responsive CopG/Arc/MetJ family transcriptional regulator